MNKVYFNVVFNRKKKLLTNGTALVQMEIYMNGRKKYFSTGIYLTPEQWDARRLKVRKHVNADKLNKRLTDLINKSEGLAFDRINSGKPLTLEYIGALLSGKMNNSFIDFMKKEIDRENLSPATRQGHSTTLKALSAFREQIHFDELTYELLADFESFLQAKKLHVNTVHKYFRHIRKYVNLAVNKEMIDMNRYPFRKFRLKSGPTNREYLTPEELAAIEKLQLSSDKKYLQKTLDIFLFACYTGLRFSDIIKLGESSIRIIDGNQWLETAMQKTGELIRIPVYMLFNGKATEILKRYSAAGHKHVFGTLTNQYVNRALKEIATLTGISKRITFHSARHTQATFLLYKGVNITTVQKLLGHKKLQTTMIYGKVMDTTIINDLAMVKY
jgi:site-specific recombinase XerD